MCVHLGYSNVWACIGQIMNIFDFTRPYKIEQPIDLYKEHLGLTENMNCVQVTYSHLRPSKEETMISLEALLLRRSMLLD